MTTQTKPDTATGDSITTPTPELTDEHVAQYLRAHSDFFTQHPELLEDLSVPHATGEAISLIERQVGILRNKNQQLERELHQLIAVAKENQQVSSKLHTFMLSVVAARGFGVSLSSIRDLLHADFPDTKVSIRLFGILPDITLKDCKRIAATLPKSKLTQALFSSHARGVVFLTKRQISNVFKRAPDNKPIHSAVAVALRKRQPLGILFLGSTDAQRFQSNMGTFFLGNLGEIISAKLQQFVTN